MLIKCVKKSSRLVASQQVHQGQQRRTILGLSKALDRRLYRAAKSVMPAISKTEDIALGCGTIGFDRDIFSGSPSLDKLLKTYDPQLTPEEQGMIDATVEFCDSYQPFVYVF